MNVITMAALIHLFLFISSSRFAVITWTVIFYFNLRLVSGVDVDTVSPSRLLSLPESSCFFTMTSLSYDTNRNVIDHLADVSFKQEVEKRSLGFGLIDLLTFKWPNGEYLSFIAGQKDDGKTFILFKKNKIDRSCLLLPSNMKEKMPTEKAYLGPVTVESLVKFLNNNCNMYRNSDGSLTIEGMHREYLLQNLFQVEHVSHMNIAKLTQIQSEYRECKLAQTDLVNNDQMEFSKKCEALKSKSKKLFQPENNLPIPTCEKIPLPSRSEFFNEYLSLSKPVIIQGAMDDWAAFKKWTNKYLRKSYGNRTVHVKLTQGGEYEGVERASLWDNFKSFEIPPAVFKQLQFPDLVVVRPAPQNIKFSKFMDIVESVSSGKLKNISAYLEYTSVDQYMPELKNDLKEMPFFKNLLELKHLNMWLSDGNTLGKTHFDPFDNFLCQVSGQKQVILFGPHEGTKMYEGHIPEAILSYNRRNHTFHRKTLLDSTSMVMSPVDIVSPDMQRFPLFADSYPLNCTINEGEVLFMPVFWWHEVQSRPNVKAGRNLAVNFWYDPFLTKEFPCAECKLDINPKYRHLL